VAAAAAVAQLIADFRISPGHQMSALWNFGTDLLVYVALTLLLSTLRTKLSEEHENARTDPLTGLGNVRAFRAAAEAEVARCRRYHRPLSLALVDLDDFKQVNDTHGHGAGDDVLRATAQHLAESVRSTDTVARVGGDEFVILLPETDPAQAAAAVGHLRSRPVAADLPVGFSVGVVTYADDPPSVEDILAEADRAMYAEKRAGRLPD
jgi:diguanylate cyclase (GGDEF)-like protein